MLEGRYQTNQVFCIANKGRNGTEFECCIKIRKNQRTWKSLELLLLRPENGQTCDKVTVNVLWQQQAIKVEGNCSSEFRNLPQSLFKLTGSLQTILLQACLTNHFWQEKQNMVANEDSLHQRVNTKHEQFFLYLLCPPATHSQALVLNQPLLSFKFITKLFKLIVLQSQV